MPHRQEEKAVERQLLIPASQAAYSLDELGEGKRPPDNMASCTYARS